MDRINSYSYLKKMGEKNLIAKVRPDSKISDHLPLLVDIDLSYLIYSCLPVKTLG